MKKILLATASLAALSGAAFAADLPSRKAAPVYAPPPPMWTGFYAGLNAGYNFGTNGSVGGLNVAPNWAGGVAESAFSYPALGPAAMSGYGNNGNNTQSGFIGGAQVGYNYQYGSNILIGLEADIQGAGIRGTSYSGGAAQAARSFTYPTSGTLTNNAIGSTVVQGGVDWLGTVRGRVGYLWTPTLLVYGTGGFAYGGVYANVVQSAIDQSSSASSLAIAQTTWIGGGRQSQLLTGWTAGGGAEWLFMPNWSIKAEALYWDLGRMNVNTASIGVSPLPAVVSNNVGYGRTSVNYQGVIARAGVNYHFNWGAAPVVASY